VAQYQQLGGHRRIAAGCLRQPAKHPDGGQVQQAYNHAPDRARRPQNASSRHVRQFWRGTGKRHEQREIHAIAFEVPGSSPIKNEATSMLAAYHRQADRVRLLLESAAAAAHAAGWTPVNNGIAWTSRIVQSPPTAPRTRPRQATDPEVGGDDAEATRRPARRHRRAYADLAHRYVQRWRSLIATTTPLLHHGHAADHQGR
jgi:hypothetical protein